MAFPAVGNLELRPVFESLHIMFTKKTQLATMVRVLQSEVES